MIVTVAAATTLPVSLSDALDHCRVSASEDEAAVLRALLAAIEHVAIASGLVLAPTTLMQQFDCWPNRGAIDVTASPVRDIRSLSYLDRDGIERTVADSDWSWARIPSGALVKFWSTWSAPSLSDLPFPVRVTFDAGYDDPAASGSGDDPDLVLPYQLRTAILLLTGHWYEMREAVAAASDPKSVPMGVDALIGRIKVYR